MLQRGLRNERDNEMALEKTRNDIITRALQLIGVAAADEDIAAADVQTSAIALDHMVKAWQGTGVHLWSRNEATLFVQPGQVKYQLGGTNTDNATEDFTSTALNGDVATGSTTPVVDSETGMIVGDFIGFILDAGGIHWTTIVSLAPLVITDSFPSAASDDNVVHFYTTKIAKALKVSDARRRQQESDIEMLRYGRIDYLNLPNKTIEGTPTVFYYDPKINFGNLFIWTAPQFSSTTILFSFLRPLDVFDTASSAPDFPDEWVETLSYNLAVRMAPVFGGATLTQDVLAIAAVGYQNILDWDQEDASVDLQFYAGQGT